MSTPATCKVVAPATLKEGATFEATVDGITFTATVPEGGVAEGDTFEVAYPSKSEAKAFAVPSGSFRDGLCSCFKGGCGLCMMGWCFPYILLAQVMQRMNFNFFGCPRVNADGTPLTGKRLPICIVITSLPFIGGFVVGLWKGLAPTSQYFWIPEVIVGWYLSVVAIITRYNMRKKFDIEGTCCGDNCCGDFLAVDCLPCCSVIQMASHSHDKDEYPYTPCTSTGLKAGAPEIV